MNLIKFEIKTQFLFFIISLKDINNSFLLVFIIL